MNTDTFTARVAAVGLVVAGLGALAAIAVLAVQNKSIPNELTMIVVAAFGILAPSPVLKNNVAHVDARELADVMPTVVRVHPDDIAKIQAVPTKQARGRSQRGGGLLATLLYVLLLLVAVALIVAVLRAIF